MSLNAAPGDIITIEDFMDNIIHYLMPAVPDYSNKITIVFSNGKRMTVLKTQKLGYYHSYNDDKCVHFSGWETSAASNLKVGDVVAGSNFEVIKDSVSGTASYRSMFATNADYTVSKIVDPADNTIFDGIDQHTFEAKMPIAGELISVNDIKNLLVNTGAKMYSYKTVYMYEWDNNKWENNENKHPDWVESETNGWYIANEWQYRELYNPVNVTDGLYSKVSASDKIQENQLISIYQLKRILSQMYSVNNYDGVEYVHRIVCHHNCHDSCHCHVRW
jgi:hypothetical protein